MGLNNVDFKSSSKTTSPFAYLDILSFFGILAVIF